MNPYHIVIATELTDESMALLEAASDVTLEVVTPTLPAVRAALKNAHVLIAREEVPVDVSLLDIAPQLKIIGRPAIGLNGVDIEAATARGVMVMNTSGVSAIAAGEHAIALMLALSRRLISAHNSLKEGYWLLDRKRQAGTQLAGKTLGVIGLGRVGNIVAQRALSFGMDVIAFDPYLSEEQVKDSRIVLVGFKELLRRSDFISLHVPVTRETHNIIDAAALAQMKRGVRLINTSHGHALDEAAVAQALKDGHLGGVAVDVYAEEPPYHSPLIGLANVIHTPHIGDNTIEAREDLSCQIVGQILDALRGIDYRHIVNMPFLPGVDFESIRPYLTLAERIGYLLHVLARYPVRRVAVEYRGEEMNGLTKPLTVALLKGLLTPVLGDTVTYVNAPLLAAERGMQVTQAKGLKTAPYTNLVSAQVTLEDGEDIVMAGTLLDHKEPHIVQINHYRLDFVPAGNLLVMGSYDKPGVIGRVGTLLAENNVNIASWHTGRAEPGGHTLTVLTVDQPLPESILAELQQQDFVRHAHMIEM